MLQEHFYALYIYVSRLLYKLPSNFDDLTYPGECDSVWKHFVCKYSVLEFQGKTLRVVTPSLARVNV